MKNVMFIFIASIFSSIGFAQGTVSIKADIANRNGDILFIKQGRMIVKEIKADEKGAFDGSFEIKKDGMYTLFDGAEYATLFLKGGYDLKIKMDAKKFDETLTFKGKGADENNFLAQQTREASSSDEEKLLEMNEADFAKAMETKKATKIATLDKSKLDILLVDALKKNIDAEQKGLTDYYKETQANKKLNNTVAPDFDYLNHAGGNVKLSDLKGKYVYIDVWATWCGPCRAEIPFLKKVEEQYHGKNIEFVSISVDVLKDFEKWKTFVTDKGLGGTQLFADKDWKSDFIRAFNINSIPRFLLIGPDGVVIDANASRPSDPKLVEKFDSLLKS